MRDEAVLGHREMDGQAPSFEAAVQIGGALDLEDKAGGELAANMRLQIAPLVVRYGRQDLKGSFAPQHQQLHELSLGDKSLLGGGYRRHPPSMAHKCNPVAVTHWPCRLRSWLWTQRARSARQRYRRE